VTDLRLNDELDLASVKFDRYTLSPAPGGTYDSNQHICLDGKKIATWMSTYNLYLDHHRRKLAVAANAERMVWRALGLPAAQFQHYAARADERRRSLLVAEPDGEERRQIEVVFAGQDECET
jgi:hypothetical protein